jgi:site-specific DNA-adenine methylase
MKTAFNGVWQAGKGHGRFNTPCGLMRHTSSVYDEENIRKWNKALQRCEITAMDFSDTAKSIGPGSYTFLDPPYRTASKEKKTFADYGTELGDSFQEKVLDFFSTACNNGSYTLLSNRDWGDGFFEDRNNGHKIEYFDVTYTVGRKKKVDEEQYEAKKAREILMIGR